jgi:hypothetical protein
LQITVSLRCTIDAGRTTPSDSSGISVRHDHHRGEIGDEPGVSKRGVQATYERRRRDALAGEGVVPRVRGEIIVGDHVTRYVEIGDAGGSPFRPKLRPRLIDPTLEKIEGLVGAPTATCASMPSTSTTSCRWASWATSARRAGRCRRPRPPGEPVVGAPTGPGSQSLGASS